MHAFRDDIECGGFTPREQTLKVCLELLVGIPVYNRQISMCGTPQSSMSSPDRGVQPVLRNEQ